MGECSCVYEAPHSHTKSQVVSEAAQGTNHMFFSEKSSIPRQPPQCTGTEVAVDCSLEDLFKGASKSVTVVNEVIDLQDKKYRQEEAVIEFKVEPGLPNKSRMKFAGRGTSRDGYIPGDVFITVNQVPHAQFTRKGSDLHSTHSITLEEALCGFSVDVKTLGMRVSRSRSLFAHAPALCRQVSTPANLYSGICSVLPWGDLYSADLYSV
ncbi:Protein psi1 [Diplonema papillatum]|nr:Protein psi1 [Diplonema papillatum]